MVARGGDPVWSHLMNIIDPNAWSFPIAGVTGWRDRHEGPFWVRRSRIVPYCVLAGQPSGPGSLPCRHWPNFPCCRVIGRRIRRRAKP